MRKKKTPSDKFNSKKEAELFIERLNKLDEKMLTISQHDIKAGNVGCETLYAMMNLVGNKIKNHPDFQNLACQYVSEALINTDSKTDIKKSFKLKRGSKHKNDITDDLRIALQAWYKIEIKKEKNAAIYSELADQIQKKPSAVKKIYDRHKHQINKIFNSIS